MDAFHRGLRALENLNDPELIEAYKAYVARLEMLLSPQEMDVYASLQQQGQVASPGRAEARIASGQEAHDLETLAVDREHAANADETTVLDEAVPDPEEQAVADKVAADSEAPALYRRYLELLGERQLHASDSET